jgi:hypothetical protein
MGSGASVAAAEIEDELPWDYSQQFIDGVRKQMVGTSPVAARKLEFQRQVRLVGKSVKHLKLIRTMQAAFGAGKKPTVKKGNIKKPPTAAGGGGGGGDDDDDGGSPKAEGGGRGAGGGGGGGGGGGKKKKPGEEEEELTDAELMQRLLLEEMKEAGLDLDGELAAELERRRLEEEARKLLGKPKKKQKQKKKSTSLVSISVRLAGCNPEPFDEDDETEFLTVRAWALCACACA